MNKELKINDKVALTAYNNTDANGRELLEHLFGKDIFHPKYVRDRIKTFNDAYHELGDKHELVRAYNNLIVSNCMSNDIIAYSKLIIIAEALNEGWKPTFNNDEYIYYPALYRYTKEEYDELNENQKKELHFAGLSGNNANADGVFFSNVNYMSSVSITNYASRIALKTRKLAEYCGKQFIDIWAEFLFA